MMQHNALRTVRAWLGPRLRTVFAGVIATALLLLTQQLGLVDALTRVVEQTYYNQRGARSTDTQTMFVRIDDETVAQWGRGPFSWDRYETLLQPILRDRPAYVAILDAGPLALPTTPLPDDLAAAVNAGVLRLPDARDWRKQATVQSDGAGRVSVLVDDQQVPPAPTSLALLLGKLTGQNVNVPHRLVVNFTGPAALPTLSALHIVRGEIPTQLFKDRVVVIGMTGHHATGSMATPVGVLAPAAVLAHGIHAVVSGAGWWLMPVWLQWLAVALLMLLVLRAMAAIRSNWVLMAGLVGLLLVVVTSGYWLFSHALLGNPGLWLSSIACAVAVGLLLERAELARRIGETRGIFANATARQDDPQALIARFHQAAARFLRANTSLWAELPAGKWHVELRNRTGAYANDVVENRCDIRRQPWAAAYMSMRPQWSTRMFFNNIDAAQTLLVPVASNGRLMGIFVFVVERSLSEGTLQIMSDMAASLGMQLTASHRPAEIAHRETALLAQLHDASRAAAALRLQKAESVDIVQALSVGIAVATTWGQLRNFNPAIVSLAKACGMTLTSGHSLEELCAALTSQSPDSVHEMLRDVAVEGAPKHVLAPLRDGSGNVHITIARHGDDAEITSLSVTAVQLVATTPVEHSPEATPQDPAPHRRDTRAKA